MRRRKDIRYLSAAELEAYRFAVLSLQRSGKYNEFVRLHQAGCDSGMVHNDDRFLPWHRRILVDFEQALRSVSERTAEVTIPYWNWLEQDPAGDVPPALRPDRVTVFGEVLRNPLFPEGVNRLALPGRTLERQSQWDEKMALIRVWSAFTSYLEGIHNHVHSNWVRGTMAQLSRAAADPIFWSHHCFVDMLWASQQGGVGRDPAGFALGLPLPLFPGATVGAMLHIADFGYEYVVGDQRESEHSLAGGRPSFRFADIIRPDVYSLVSLRFDVQPVPEEIISLELGWGGNLKTEVSLFGCGGHHGMHHGGPHLPSPVKHPRETFLPRAEFEAILGINKGAAQFQVTAIGNDGKATKREIEIGDVVITFLP